MTGITGILGTYSPSFTHPNVKVADGSIVAIKGIGTTCPTSTLCLSFALYLLALLFNLLSVSPITRDLNYSITFCGDFCEFQDLSTRTIVRGRLTS